MVLTGVSGMMGQFALTTPLPMGIRKIFLPTYFVALQLAIIISDLSKKLTPGAVEGENAQVVFLRSQTLPCLMYKY